MSPNCQRRNAIELLTELRTIHDWVVKPQLRTVRGVAEVNSWGGYEKQYQVRIDPDRLDQARPDVRRSRRGGSSEQSQCRRRHDHARKRGCCWFTAWAAPSNIEQIGNIVITAKDGVPIRVRDVADVQIGHEIRRGAVTANGRGEAVLGLGFMLMGENSHEVTWALKNKLEEIKETLPAGMQIQTVYDRTELVDHVIDTVQQEPVRRRAARHRRAVRFSGQSAGGLDRGAGDSAVDAVCVFGHAAVRHRREPA